MKEISTEDNREDCTSDENSNQGSTDDEASQPASPFTTLNSLLEEIGPQLEAATTCRGRGQNRRQ